MMAGILNRGMAAFVPTWMILPLFCLMVSPVCAAKTDSPMVKLNFSTTKDGERFLLVTCGITLAKGGMPSPKVTISLLDGDGTVLQRMAGYGGRYYRLSLLSRLDRQTASAVAASPVRFKVKKAGMRRYQFLFFDLSPTAKKMKVFVERPDGQEAVRILSLGGSKDAMGKVDISFLRKTNSTPSKPQTVRKKFRNPGGSDAAQRSKEGVKAKRQPQSTSKPDLIRPNRLEDRQDPARPNQSSLRAKIAVSASKGPDSFSPSLVRGGSHVAFAERLVIVSYLDDELRRLLEGENRQRSQRTEPMRRTSDLSSAQIKAALAPYDILPLWEYVHTGMDFKTASQRLAPEVYPSTKAVKLVVMDCVMGLCEYVLEGVSCANVDYRLYFKKKTLKSMVVALPFVDAAKRRAFLEVLRSIYGGNIMDRGVGPELGDLVSRFEFSCQCNGMFFETSGKLLRVFTQ